MKFNTRYSRSKPKYSNRGEKMQPVWDLVIDSKGKEVVKQVGETDLHAAIQAEYASVNLDMILARFDAGDATALERAKGFYADVSELPVKLQDVLNMNYEAEKFFNSLPVEVKKIYGNNYRVFINDPQKLVDFMSNEPVIDKEDEKVEKEEVKKDDDKEQ